MDKLWNKNYNSVLAGNFLMFFSFQMLVPMLPLYLTDRFGATKEEIGVVLAGYVVAALVIRPFSGYVVDTFDRRKVLLLCYALFAAFFSGYLLAGSMVLFAIVRILHGGPFGAATVANSTAAIDVLPPSRRAEGIGFYGLAGNLAMAIGPVIGLSIYHGTGNYNTIFCLCLGTSLVGLYVMYKVKGLHNVQRTKDNVPCTKDNVPCTNLSIIAEDQEARVVTSKKISLDSLFLTNAVPEVVSMVCYAFSYGVVSTYVAIYAKDELGVRSGTGLFFTLLAIGLILSRFQGARALRAGRIAHNADVGVCLSLVGILIFASLHYEFAMYVAAFTLGLGNGHMFPAYQNMFINMAPDTKSGTANSTIFISWDLGLGLGMLAGGVVAEHFGYHAAFWVAWLMNLSGVLLYALYGRKHYLNNKL